MSPSFEKITLQILGYSATPYVIDYQSVTKTVFISPGPSIFPTFLHIYTRKSASYVECFEFFYAKLTN